jgi:hypothetical protein
MRRLEIEEVRRYTWADGGRELAWAMAVVTGRDWRDVLRSYGGDPDQEAAMMAFNEAHVSEDDIGRAGLVQVRREGEFVLMIENNGWLGVTQGVPERASAAGGHLMCAYWSDDGHMLLIEATDGHVDANFDPVLAVNRTDWSEDPDWAREVPWEFGKVQSTMLAVVEWRTGLAFDRAWLDEPTPTYHVSYSGTQTANTPSPTAA